MPVSSWSVLICHHREQELRLLGQVRRITFYFFPLPVSHSFPLPTWRLRGRRSSVPIPITTTYAPSNWCYRFLSFLRGERPLSRSCYSREASAVARATADCRRLLVPPGVVEGHLAQLEGMYASGKHLPPSLLSPGNAIAAAFMDERERGH